MSSGSARMVLYSVQSNKKVKGVAADAMRKAALDLAKRNPELQEAKILIDTEMKTKGDMS